MYEIYMVPVVLVCFFSSYAIMKVCLSTKLEEIEEEIEEGIEECTEGFGKSLMKVIEKKYNSNHPNKRMNITFGEKK